MHSLLSTMLPLAAAAGYASAAAISAGSSCHDLWEVAPKLLSDLEVYIAQDYPAGTNLTTKWATIAYPQPVPNLPDFCRFGAFIHTSEQNKVQFEVWLPPADVWSGRFGMAGNGGDSGGVNFPDMWGPLARHQMAIASTDTGHHGASGNGTFALNNPESQVDFGYRAVHLTTVYSKKIIEAYYGRAAKKSYWMGCSSGGKQGLKEAQMYPNDYDGILAGAAAQFWDRLSAQIWRINAIINPPDGPDYLTRADFDNVGAVVLAQCDEIDGLKDGLIASPLECKPDLRPIACDTAGSNSSSCLSAGKIAKMNLLYNDWYGLNNSFIYFNYLPGAEALPSFAVTGTPYSLAPDYFQYRAQQVVNATELSNFTVTDEAEFEKIVRQAIETNPGGITADDPDISDFLKHGKVLTYVGLSDTIIPPESSIWYRNLVYQAMGYPEDFDDYYRLFTVPGMGHCQNGPGAWHFGGAGERPLSLKGRQLPLKDDAEHDIVAALIDWVENGKAPEKIIGAKYTDDDKTKGVDFTRPHCVWPKQAIYKGKGDPNEASSFFCGHLGGSVMKPGVPGM
ncbi:hypothetical protein Rhopal_005166-T1 [Rhodotorula paludigena]|uniref:Carboxylic ester hydrolase n=1 Tax=Rhodotorula paludigena TaxID=86838 RepID=A0AAV5GHP8_9BASI|nr:hypothetical protein Rhopal_005166-T1 [Rhodotorula paludigena]